MDIQTRITVLQTVLALTALAFVWLHVYRRTKLDCYREDLFTLRDELFDTMWQNGHDFDLPAYRMLRRLLNGGIRGAGLISPFSVLCLALINRRRPPPPDPLAAALSAVEDGSLRHHLRDVRQAFLNRTLRFLFGEGLLGILLRPVEKPDWAVASWMGPWAVLGDARRPFPGMVAR